MASRRSTLNELLARFAVHMFVGSAVFVAVGLVAVALGLFVSWMDGQQHVPKAIVATTHWLEYGLFAGDASLFAIFIVRSTWLHGKEMMHAPLAFERQAHPSQVDQA
jgi:hypothetical protein